MFWWWDALYWLPRGVGWSDMNNKTTEPGYMYPHYSHLWMTVITGISLIIYRFVFENYIFIPLAYFLSRKNPPETRQGVLDREKKYTRMAECAMRSLYYTVSFCCGLYLVSNESHFYDITECWRKWPFHPIPTAIAWYYWIQGGFYISLVFGIIFLDAKRSDFWQMLIHHFITLALGWNLLDHEYDTDLGKILRYEQLDTALAICFGSVLIVWVATRLVYYPFWIIRSVWFDAPALIQDDYEWLNLAQQPQAPRFIMFLLTALLVLHIFWAYILFKIAYDTVKYGVVDDVREDFDENSAVNREKAKAEEKNKDD
uniref:TLC domain-containing protein n=1 Tax=Caenorhabditis tropicalis TaxID=1561998 RepID=A0A1I7TIK4_9PELO